MPCLPPCRLLVSLSMCHMRSTLPLPFVLHGPTPILGINTNSTANHGRLALFRSQEISHDAMSLFRLRVKVTMTLARKDDQLGIRNSLRQDVGAGAMRQVADHKMIVVPHKDQGRYFDVFQSPAGIMSLPRQDMAEIKFHRTEIGHSHLEIFLD